MLEPEKKASSSCGECSFLQAVDELLQGWVVHEPQQAALVERPLPTFAGRRDREGLQAAGLEDLNGLPWRHLGRVSPNGVYELLNAYPSIHAPERGRTEFYWRRRPARSLCQLIISQAEQEA